MDVGVEIGGQILVAVYAVLTADAELCVLMNGTVESRGEWLYSGMAEEDAEFPYLVHALERGQSGVDWALQDSIYRIDPWVLLPIDSGLLDYSETRLRLIMDCLISLLDRRTLTGDAFSWARLDLAPGMMAIPTDNKNVLHATIPFDVRHARTREIANVLAR